MVYYVTSLEDDSVLVAINPTIRDEPDRMIAWSDTHRMRRFGVERFEHRSERRIVFLSDMGRHYTLVPLTLARYVQHVVPRSHRPPHFTSDQAVQDFYEQDYGQEYTLPAPQKL